MIVTKSDEIYVILSLDDKMLQTIKQSIPNAQLVDISVEEYNQMQSNLTELQELIKSKIGQQINDGQGELK